MLWQRTVGVVVPAYNEAGLVGEVIETLPALVDRIYVVDDASTDDTWAEVTARAERGDTPSPGRLVPIRHAENRGVGGAIKTGYERALADEIDVTVVLGGDGQMDPDYLTDLVTPIISGRAEYTKADRFHSRRYGEGMSGLRLFGNVVLSLLTRIASGYWWLSDPQNGYTAISLQALEAVDVGSMYEYYGYCNDLLVKLNVAGMRVADVPVPAVYGEEESSIAYPSYVYRVSRVLAADFLWRLRTKYVADRPHPLVVCYLLGGWFLWAGPVLILADVASTLAVLVVTGVGVALLLVGAELDRRENRPLEVTLDA